LPLQTVESTRLYRQIADQIAALIARGEFHAGERLPAERELATLLGVSRTSVREAIICLELEGRVEVRVGTGIFVTHEGDRPAARVRPVDSRVAANDEPGPFELLAARRLIEGEIAALAARSIRRRDVAALRDTMSRMSLHGDDFNARDTADREFHVRIAKATGNGALAAVVDTMWDQRRGELWSRMEAHFHTPELHARTLEDHAAIVAALEARDPEAARAAMHRHLTRVAREFQRKWDGGGARPAGH
jgi:DNA-binding FadR family transcriptional regulator